MNINQDCGSMHPEATVPQGRRAQARTSASRTTATPTAFCSATKPAQLIDGDDIMAIAALDMLAQKTLAEKTLVATVMSNAGLEAAIKAAGGKMHPHRRRRQKRD